MKRFTLALLVAFVVACGGDPSGPTTPPPAATRDYVLTELNYEDAYPGVYVKRLNDSTFQGGPAVIAFGTNSGEIRVATALTAVLEVTPDTSATARIEVLPAGTFAFQFQSGDSGAVQLNLDFWGAAGTLTDSAYVGDFRQCYNADCSDHIYLSFRWVRQP